GDLTRLFCCEERLTDEWAERLYAAHCEAWSQQNRAVPPAFIPSVRDRAIIQLIGVRKSTVQFGVGLRAKRIGAPPNPVALGEWNRRMDRLAARWSRRLEADARSEERRVGKE